MSKYIAVIPRADITRTALVEANGRSMDQVKADCGCSHIINSWFYDQRTGRPVGNLCIDGVVKASESWVSYGLTWNEGADMAMEAVPGTKAKRTYLSGVELLAPLLGPKGALDYVPEYGGSRGRSAVLLAGDKVVLYCSGDGTADAKNPERLRDELVSIGTQYAAADELRALGLDSGSSSNCDFGGGARISNGKRVKGYLCIWTRETAPQTPPAGMDYKVTPSIGVNVRKGPGTGYDKVGAYPRGTVVSILEEQDGWGRTKDGWVAMQYLVPMDAPQRCTDTGIGIQTAVITAGRRNRPMAKNKCAYITIHETGNPAKGADAAAHGKYLDSAAAEKDWVSWHYTVDDHAIYQHLSDEETAYHAGDGADGPGNTTSIGIEICVNQGGGFEQAKRNAASLVRLLMAEHSIPLDHVVQHNHWSGKNCPMTIRATPGGWDSFLALCEGPGGNVSKLDTAVDKLAAAGLIDNPDYWRGCSFSIKNVHALLIKWADTL